MTRSLAEDLALLSPSKVMSILRRHEVTAEEMEEFLADPWLLLRPEQFPPVGDWTTWLIQTGRGWGKTLTAAYFVRQEVDEGRAKRIALIGGTAGDVRDVMIEGESGLMSVYTDGKRPEYLPGKRRVEFQNGATATCYSADAYERLRGPQHDLGWLDELCAWSYPRQAWENFRLGLRIGRQPRCVVTTTPRPLGLLREIRDDPSTVITCGNTLDNRANLAPIFILSIIARYAGTRLARQEIAGIMLTDDPDALWKRETMIVRWRIPSVSAIPCGLVRTIIFVDPPAKKTDESAEAGIIAAALGADGHGYVLEDGSGRMHPEEWGSKAVRMARRWATTTVMVENNQGGEMAEDVVKQIDRTLHVEGVFASSLESKYDRAEPVSVLYARGMVHHVGEFPELEDQMCTWTGKKGDPSPDRIDALAHALRFLMLSRAAGKAEVIDL